MESQREVPNIGETSYKILDSQIINDDIPLEDLTKMLSHLRSLFVTGFKDFVKKSFLIEKNKVYKNKDFLQSVRLVIRPQENLTEEELTGIVNKFVNIHGKTQIDEEMIAKFFFSERVHFVKCMINFFRKIVLVDEKFVDIWTKNVDWLIEKGMNATVISMLRSNIPMLAPLDLKSIKDESKEMQKRLMRRSIMLNVNLLDVHGELIDLLIMMYYSGKAAYNLKVLEHLIEQYLVHIKFGFYFFQLARPSSDMTTRRIKRIIALYVLLFVVLLNIEEEHKEEGDVVQQIYKISTFLLIYQKDVNKMFTGALFLSWAAFVKLHVQKLEVKLKELEKDPSPGSKEKKVSTKKSLEMCLKLTREFVEKGLKLRGLEYFIYMFDRNSKENYPFFGHEQNLEAYKEICCIILKAILSIIDITSIPYPFLKTVVGVFNNLNYSPNFRKDYLAIENHFLRYTVMQRIHDPPFSYLVKFLLLLLPLKTELFQSFAYMCYDSRSTFYVFQFLDDQKTFTIEMKKELFSKICRSKEHSPKNYVLLIDYRYNWFKIPKGTSLKLIYENEKDVHNTTMFQIQFSGWKYIFSQIVNLEKNLINMKKGEGTGVKLTIEDYKHFFVILEKVILYGNDQVLNICDMLILEILHPQGDFHVQKDQYVPGMILCDLIFKILLNLKKIKYLDIISGCCKCLKSFSMNRNAGMVTIVENFMKKFLGSHQSSNYFNQIIQQEGSNGEYECSVALLDSIKHLSRTVGNIECCFFLMDWINSYIFISHNSWKYKHMEEKWLISLKSIEIFNQVIRDSHVTKHKRVLQIFFENSSNSSSALFHILGFAYTSLKGVVREEKGDEEKLVQKLIEESLTLLETLLNFRNKFMKPSEPLDFEKGFDLIVGKKFPLILILFKLTKRKFNEKIRIKSCNVLRNIMLLPKSPSIIASLGSKAVTIVKMEIDYLSRIYESVEFKISLIDLIGTIVLSENRKGLSQMFVNYDPSKRYENEQNLFTLHTALESVPRNSFLDAIFKILNLYEKENDKLVYSCLNLIRNIFNSSHHRDLVRILRNELGTNLWEIIFKIIGSLPQDWDEISLHRIKSILKCLEIITIDIYHGKALNTYFYDQEMKGNLFKQFQKNDEMFHEVLDTSISFIRYELKSNVPKLKIHLDLIQKHVANYNPRFKISDYYYYMEDKELLYDVDLLKRWEDSGEIDNLLFCSEDINTSLAKVDAFVNVIDSMRKLFQVFYVPYIKYNSNESGEKGEPSVQVYTLRYLPRLIKSLMYGLESKSNFPRQLDYIQTLMNLKSSYCLLSISKGIAQLNQVEQIKRAKIRSSSKTKFQFPPMYTNNNVRMIANSLSYQVDYKKEEVGYGLLANLMFFFTKLDNFRVNDECLVVLNPILVRCVKKFGPGNKCTDLGLRLLSIIFSRYSRNSGIEFICSLLQKEKENIHLQEKKYPNYIINLIETLISVGDTDKGVIILKMGTISTISEIIKSFSSDGNVYENEEHLPWHKMWNLLLKLVCTLLLNIQESYQYEKFLFKHTKRIIYSLTTMWKQNPLKFAEIEEVQLIGMIFYYLSRSETMFFFHNIPFLSAVCHGFSNCVETLRKRLNPKDPSIKPITKKEKKMYEEDSLINSKKNSESTTVFDRSFQLLDKRKHISWNGRLYLSIFGSLRSFLCTIRKMTVLSFEKGIELPILKMDQTTIGIKTVIEPNVFSIIELIQFCMDLLEIIFLSKQNVKKGKDKLESKYHVEESLMICKIVTKVLRETVETCNIYIKYFKDDRKCEKLRKELFAVILERCIPDIQGEVKLVQKALEYSGLLNELYEFLKAQLLALHEDNV